MLNKKIFFITLSFIGSLWIIYLLDCMQVFNKLDYSISPKNGWWSILTGGFLHGNLPHLIGNTKGLLLSVPLVLYLYKNNFTSIMILGILIPATVVYCLGFNTVGISGLVYALIWFLIFSGIGSEDKIKFLVSMALIIFYGSTLTGITQYAGRGISYHGHLSGFAVGLICSIIGYFKKNI